MAFAPTSPVTGGAQTGFTSPTYTIVVDQAPDVNGSQYAVTAVGGTQTGVRTSTAADPFTAVFWRAKVLKGLPSPNAVTGRYGNIPRNTYGWVIRKGMQIAANQPAQVGVTRITHDIPAGADSYDAANIRAMHSLTVGLLSQTSAGVGDTLVTGIM